jgi:putative flippase GtrA
MFRAVSSYSLVSGFCYALNNGLLIGFDWAGLPLWMNLIISADIVITAGYLLQSVYTFRTPLGWRSYGRYLMVMVPNVPVAYVLLWILDHWLPMVYAAPIVTTILLMWNAVGSVWALRRAA